MNQEDASRQYRRVVTTGQDKVRQLRIETAELFDVIERFVDATHLDLASAKTRLSHLLRAVEHAGTVVIDAETHQAAAVLAAARRWRHAEDNENRDAALEALAIAVDAMEAGE